MFRKGNHNLLYRPKYPSALGKADWSSLATGCVCSLASALCFAWSGIHMLTEEFPEMAAYSDGRLPVRGILAVLVVMVLLFELPGRRFWLCRRVLAGLVPLAGVLAAGRVWAEHEKELLAGCLQAAGIVIAAVNRHYKFNFPVPEGQAGYCSLAVVCICGAFLTVFLYAACLGRRRWIVMGFPLLVLALGLMAGYPPGMQGITEGFIGLLFCQAGGWESAWAARGEAGRTPRQVGPWAARLLSLALLGLLAVLLPFGISSRFSGTAESLADSGEGVVAIQRKMEEILELNIQQFSFAPENAAKENINNRKPRYKEQEILRVTLAVKPERTLYFRGFYGGEYAGGGWNSRRDVLLESLDGQKWTEEDVARWLGGRGNIPKDRTGEWDGFPEECTIQYLRRGSTVYAPYFLAPGDPEGELRYGGEYRIIKEKSLDTVRFGEKEDSAAYTEQEKRGIAEWYTSYVRGNYVSGSKAVPSAGRIAEELLGWYSETYSRTVAEEFYEAFADSSDSSLVFGFSLRVLSEMLESTDAEVRNYGRLQFAHIVSEYLSSGVYSQELDQVPGGTDVVEYFLAESQTGYCVHYASAGVLILQAMGIPARYASGYVAAASDFKGEDGRYAAAVKDSAAHAWAEIYLEDIGWVPVEMTPGYADRQTAVLDEETMMLGINPTLQNRMGNPELPVDGEGQEGPEELPEASASSDDTGASETKVSSNTPEISGASQASGSPGGTGGEVSGKGAASPEKRIRSVILIAAFTGGILAVVVFLLYLFTVKKQRSIQLLLRDIRRKKNRQAVLRMNRAMYRRVRAKNRQWFARMSDEEYRLLLIRTYPDTAKEAWGRFISIVRKASFSRSEISDEEVQDVYTIYHKG